MKKVFKNIFFVLVIMLVVCIGSISTLAVSESGFNLSIEEMEEKVKEFYKLEIVDEDYIGNSSLERNIKKSFNGDEDVKVEYSDLKIKGVTYYDEDGNIIRQFFGEDAIKYLYLRAFEEETILENEFFNSAYVIPNSKYECEVIETSYEKRKITPLIKKKMNLDKINALALIIDAGLEFKEPIYNVLKTAAGVILDAYSIDEIECNAEDMVQTEYFEFETKEVTIGEKKDNKRPTNCFKLIKRDTSLFTSYILKYEGKAYDCTQDYGKIESSYPRVFDNDKSILALAIEHLNNYAPYYTINFDDRQKAITESFSNRVRFNFREINYRD